jgi:hypothetical protein
MPVFMPGDNFEYGSTHHGVTIKIRIGFVSSCGGKGVATPRFYEIDRRFGRCVAVGGARATAT